MSGPCFDPSVPRVHGSESSGPNSEFGAGVARGPPDFPPLAGQLLSIGTSGGDSRGTPELQPLSVQLGVLVDGKVQDLRAGSPAAPRRRPRHGMTRMRTKLKHGLGKAAK